MAGPNGPSRVRQPAVAGLFYPADARECRQLAGEFVREGETTAIATAEELVDAWGAIVPHAGWICSGAIAGEAIAALARRAPRPDVVVVFGAVHTPLHIDFAALPSHERWQEPAGDSEVAHEVTSRLSEAGGLFAIDDRFHETEHAVEVELPLIQLAWPAARVLPMEVPLIDDAATVGRTVAQDMEASGVSAVFLASSDLTHYGPAYGFAPAGVGMSGLAWAKDNDRRLLERVMDMAVDRIVPDVRAQMNACGGGAIAAMMAACRERGATRGQVLRHANSFETLADIAPQRPDNAVGYAGALIGR
ncbi:MAG TPA: AmmeMemoRadiSam system protein B [Tepidisphaeraceae bacterium]|nr:AmmeMemoRadiSam system protein B [Tepidisphaeraceae bacterium]